MQQLHKIVLLLFVTVHLSAQAPQFKFDDIGKKHKLNNNYIESIIQDKYGYMWFTTDNGLYRFDGYSSKVYKHIEDDSTSITNNVLHNLFEDRKGRLWVGYGADGFSLYNREKDNFTNFVFQDTSSVDGVLKNIVRDIYEDVDNNIWVLNAFGVAKLNQTDSIWHWYTHSLDSVSFRNKYSYTITQLKDSTILLGFRDLGSLYRYDATANGFVSFSMMPEDNNSAWGNSISQILQDSEGYVWIGTIESGLIKYNPNTNTFKQYLVNEKDPYSISSNEIIYLYEDSKQNFWIGTINGGLLLYDRIHDRFFNYKQSDFELYSLGSNSITGIVEDAQGNIWISSHGGVFVMDYRRNFFKFYGRTINKPREFDGKRVACFYEAEDKTIWIGTDGDGLFSFDQKTGHFEKFTTKNGLLSDAVIDIDANGDGSIWLATWGGGISLFNPHTKKCINYTSAQKQSINYSNIKGVLKDGDLLWVATNGKGVNIFDTKKGIFYNRETLHKEFNFDLSLPTWGNDIYKDRNGNIWIVTALGLFRWDGVKLHEYYSVDDDKNTLSGNIVNCISEDGDGTIWIGTQGLDRYNREEDNFTRMKTIIPNVPEAIRSIVQDKNGKLWIGTKDGIYTLNMRDSSINHFTESDGLLGNQFIERAAFVSSDGELFFGGHEGFNVFSPENIKPDTYIPPTYITSFTIFDIADKPGMTSASRNLIHNEEIIVSYYESRTISLDYVGINYHAPESIKYAYMLEGFDKKLRFVGNERKATYTNLKPGTYVFKVKSQNKNGYWNEAGDELTFTVLSPWWLSWWFKTIFLIIIVLSVFLFIHIRERNIRKYNNTLQQTVSERTQELEETNVELEEQRLEVLSQYNKLKENQLVIRMRNEELNETIKMKDKLLSIVAHDLKSPLNSIIGFSQLLKEKVQSNTTHDKIQHYVELISASSVTLHSQLNNLFDWARSQANNLKYQPRDIHLVLIIRDVISLLSDAAYSKQININADFNVTSMAHIDSRMISTVIRNLLSNSIKFTPRGGTISVALEENESQILINVKDTGVGMNEEQLQRLFVDDSSNTTLGTEREYGTGFGLKICKEFIEMNKGDLFVSSEVGHGTLFTVTLPKGKLLPQQILSSNADVVTPLARQKLILIIDDNYEVVEYISDIFENVFRVETAYNGKEGLLKAKDLIPDIIISDITMPAMDGRELVRLLKKEHLTSHIPVIFVTAETNVRDEIYSFEVGASDYITKPFNKEVLKLKVNALIQNRIEYRNYLKKEVLITPLKELNTESKDESLLRRINELVEAHLKTPDLSVEFLAKEIGVSRAQLFRKFKAILSYSPVEYIRMYRLQRAAQMLETGKFRISEVAYDVGFSDPKYFSTCFSKQFGQTPSEYLKSKQ